MNIVLFAADPAPLPIKLIMACLIGLLPGILSGRFRTDGKIIVIPFLIAVVAGTILINYIVEIEPGIIALFGGLVIGCIVFLLARSSKASFITAIIVTLTSIAAIVFVALMRLPPAEMRHAIANIRQCGGVVQQSDNPGITYLDQWLVDFEFHGINDDQLLTITSDLQQLPKLWLKLSYCPVGDQSIEGFANAENLVQLDLNKTLITDHGLNHLANLSHLENLNLSNTSISDEGLTSLAKLESLEILILTNTDVTEEGVQELQKSLPKCKVIYGKNSKR